MISRIKRTMRRAWLRLFSIHHAKSSKPAGSNSKLLQCRIQAQAFSAAQCFRQALAHLWGTEQVGSLSFRFDFAPKFDWKHRGGFFALFVFTIWTSVVSRGLKDADHALRMRLAAFGQLTRNCRKLECLALFGCRLKLGVQDSLCNRGVRVHNYIDAIQAHWYSPETVIEPLSSRHHRCSL